MNLLNFVKRQHNSDYCLSLTQLSNPSQSIFKEKFDQSILVIGGLLLKIQAWAFFIVLGAYREIQKAKDSSVIDLEVPDFD